MRPAPFVRRIFTATRLPRRPRAAAFATGGGVVENGNRGRRAVVSFLAVVLAAGLLAAAPSQSPLSPAGAAAQTGGEQTGDDQGGAAGPAAPSVSGVSVASDPGADGSYGPGDQITVELSFSEPVSVDTAGGTPRLSIDLSAAAGGEVWADYASGGGTAVLAFAYEVVSTDSSTDGVAVVADSLESNGGSVASVASGVAAELSHAGLAHDASHLVDGSQQAGTPVAPPDEQDEQDEADQAGSECPSEPGEQQDQNEAGSPPATPQDGDPGDGGDAECPAPPDDQDEAGAECPEAPAGNGGVSGSGQDDQGNAECPDDQDEAGAECPEAPAGNGGVSGSGQDDQGDAECPAPPDDQDEAGAECPEAQAGDGQDGDEQAGAECPPEQDEQGDQGEQAEDPAAPSVVGLAITSQPGAYGLYGLGERIDVQLLFSEPVSVDTSGGTPRLKIDFSAGAGGEVWAGYAAGGGTSILRFSYEVAPADFSTDGVAVVADSLELNGGSVASGASGAAAALSHEGLGHNPGHALDASRPAGGTARAANEASEPDLPAGCGAVANPMSNVITGVASSITTITVTYGSAANAGTNYGSGLSLCKPGGSGYERETVKSYVSAEVPGEGDTFEITGLLGSTDYWVRYNGNFNDGNTYFSEWFYIRTKEATPPSAPSAPTVTATSPSGVAVGWSAPSDLGSGTTVIDYDLRYYAGTSDPADEDDWITEGETGAPPDPGTGTSARILGLAAGTAYRVQVRAFVDAWSPWSASLAVTTPVAPSSGVLISNAGQNHASYLEMGPRDIATGFTTGANAGGYLLTGVDLNVSNLFAENGHQVSVKIATGLPSGTTVVATLFSPLTFSAGFNTLAAPSGTVLDANTTYWVVAESDVRGAGKGPLSFTNSGDEDSGGSSGWSIGGFLHSRNWDSAGAWTQSSFGPLRIVVRGAAADVSPPTVSSTEVRGDDLQVRWNEDLDTSSLPSPGAFTVTAGSRSVSVATVTVASSDTGNDVTVLTLASPVLAGQAVTLSYTKPSTNPLRDPFGNEVASFTGTEITNVTTLTVTGVEISSMPCTADTYGGGDIIRVTLTLSEPVNVDTTSGTPRLKIDLHTAPHGEKWADYESGGGTAVLTFAYTVAAGNASTDGVAVVANTLELNGGTIKSALNTDAMLAHAGLGHDPYHQVDGTKATAGTRCEQILAYSAPGDGGTVLSLNGAPFEFAAGFTTGAAAGGYTVSRVRVDLKNTTNLTGAVVKLASGLPRNVSDVGGAFTNPSTGAGSGSLTEFTAPDGGVLLSANTNYWMLVEQAHTLSLMGILAPPAHSWDQGGAPGWSVGDLYRRETTGDDQLFPLTGSSNSAMHFQVLGFGPDETAPSFMSAAVNDDMLTITFDESLDDGSEPAASAFTVTVAGTERTVSDVSITGAVVTLTLSSPVDSGQTVTVSYTRPAADPLQDPTGNDVATFGDQAATNSTVAPAVTGVEITSDPGTDSTYGLDETIEVSVTFNKPVYVDTAGGTPRLEIDFVAVAGGEVWAGYAAGDGTSILRFSYEVLPADASTDGVAVVANRLQPNGGTIKSQGGADATLTYTALGHDTDHLVDGSVAGNRILVSNFSESANSFVSLASRVQAQGFRTGSSRFGYVLRDVELGFQTAPAGLTVKLATGLPSAVNTVVTFTNPATLAAGNLRFTAPADTVLDPSTTYWVVVEGTSGNLLWTESTAEDGRGLDDWRINDGAFVRSKTETNFVAVNGARRIRVNGVAAPLEPVASAVEIVSDPGVDDLYGLNERIQVQVTFNQVVNVDTTGGTPRLTIDFHMAAASGEKWADYVSGSGTAALVFEYAVTAGNRSTDGVAVTANTLELNGGTIRSADGLRARLAHGGLEHDTGHQVDGSMAGSRVLVSTIAQAESAASHLSSFDAAQGFTTGSNATGYFLHDVEVRFGTEETPAGLTVKLATGLPSATNTVTTLTNPATLATGNLKFTAPADTVLDPSTEYWVVVAGTAGTVVFTGSDAEDEGGLDDWSVGDGNYIRGSNNNWRAESATRLIRVSGLANPARAPSAPTAPTVTARSSHTLSLSWAQPSDLGTASSITDYDLRYYAGSSDPADDADWVTEGDTGAPPDPGAATTAKITGLAAGTDYRVQVRALGDVESPWSASVSATTMRTYDTDYDGRVEVSSVEQLNAMRWDIDGDGEADPPILVSPEDRAAHMAAFPDAGDDQCDDPSTGSIAETCSAYELVADIDLDVAPYNTGSGWDPIGGLVGTPVHGNNHTISGLFIDRPDESDVGLFSNASDIRDLALVDVDVTGGRSVGAFTASGITQLSNVFASGTVTASKVGAVSIGGLSGSANSITDSFSAVHVVADAAGASAVGGLAGNTQGVVTNSYAVGSVTVTGTGANSIGGLAGNTAGIVNSYSLAAVSVPADATEVGGLRGAVSANNAPESYWNTETSGQAESGAGTARTTSQLQSPTAPGANAGDTYHGWDTDVWDFGTSSQYPALKGLPLTPAEQRAELDGVALSVSAVELAEDSGSMSVTITGRLLGPTRSSQTRVSLDLEGTATQGASDDYTWVLPDLLISANQRTGSVTRTLAVVDDTANEDDETIVVSGRDSTHSSYVVPAVILLTDNDAPTITLTVDDDTVAEGETATTVSVTATLDDGTARDADVTVTLKYGGTADGGGTDYTAGGVTSITIPMGATSADADITITPNDDDVDDDDETIIVDGTATGFRVIPATITIEDNDGPSKKVRLTVSPATLAEQATSTAVTVTATLDGAVLTSDVDVTLSLSGDASSDDYTAPDELGDTDKDITITMGQKSASAMFNFNVPRDMIDEPDETITVGGTVVGGGLAAAADTADITITDHADDTAMTTIALSVNDDSISEEDGETAITVTATLAGTVKRSVATVVVLDASLDTTATASDYSSDYGDLTEAQRTITIPAGSLSADATSTFSVTPVREDLVDGNKTINIGGQVGDGTVFTVNDATITLADDDTPSTSWTLSVSPASLSESADPPDAGAPPGTPDPTLVTVKAELDGGTLASAVNVTLSVDTTDPAPKSTAVRDTGTGGDYTAPAALGDADVDITIAMGSKSAEITLKIDPTQDTLDEGTGETIVISGVATGGLTTTETATLTITDDDTLVKTIQLSFDPASVGEDGSATTVTVEAELQGSATSVDDLVVALESVLTGTATAGTGNDYTHTYGALTPKSITIPAGSSSASTTASFTITPLQDDDSEPTETIEVTGTLTDYTVNKAVFDLIDDDLPRITLSVSDDTIAETEEEATAVDVTATFADGMTRDDDVEVTLSLKGDAVADDYTVSGLGNITIPEGSTSAVLRNVMFTPINDRLVENDEDIDIVGVVGDGTKFAVTKATITLTSEDIASTSWTLSVSPASLDEAADPPAADAPPGTPDPTEVTVRAELDGGTLTSAVNVTLSVDTTDPDPKSTAVRDTGTGGDYTAPAALGDADVDITIPAGETSAEITLSIDPTQDTLDEGTGETIVISGAATGGLPTTETATVTINDDDTLVKTIRLSFDPASVRENETANATAVTVKAELQGSATSPDDLVVALASSLTGTATEGEATGNDYTHNYGDLTTKSITIPAGSSSGSTTASFDITPLQDEVVEGIETIEVTGESCLTVPSGNDPCPDADMLTVNKAVFNLIDDDKPRITLRVNDSEIVEGEGATKVIVTASFADGMTRDTNVEVTLSLDEDAPNAATRGSGGDYTVTGLTRIIIAKDSTLGLRPNVTFTPRDDFEDDDDEKIVITGSHADFTVDPVTINIKDNDEASTKVILTVSPATLAETADSTPVQVTATLDGAVLSSDVEVTLSLPASTAAGAADSSDYAAPGALNDNMVDLTIPMGATEVSKTFNFDPSDDTIDEGDETITVGGTATQGLNLDSATITITDDPADVSSDIITLTVNDDTIAETESGTTTVTVTATLGDETNTVTRSTDTVVTLSEMLGGTADEGMNADYTSTYGSLTEAERRITIRARSLTGTATETFTIDPNDDDDFEPDQNIVISGDSSRTDDDVVSASITLTSEDLRRIQLAVDDTSINEEADEDGATVNVTATMLDGTVATDTVVTLTFDGTADRDTGTGGDYTASGSVIIRADADSGTAELTITPDNDRIVEADKTIIVGGTADNFRVLDAADITLVNDDAASTDLTLTVSPTSLLESADPPAEDAPEGTEDPTLVTVTAELDDGALTSTTTVTLTLGSTGATKGTDYTDPGTLPEITIDAGQHLASKTFNIDPIDDNIDEDDETITINVAVTGALTLSKSATLTITDNDTASKRIILTTSPTSVNEEPSAAATTITVKAAFPEGSATRNVATTVGLSISDDGTATVGETTGNDYSHSSLPTITIPAEESEKTETFTITPIDDSVSEALETIIVSGEACFSGDDPCTTMFDVGDATIHLVDDESPSFSLSATPRTDGTASVEEGDSATFTITATRLGTTTASYDVPLAVLTTSTATSGTDYNALSSLPTISIDEDASTGTAVVTIDTIEDRVIEGHESIMFGSTSTTLNVLPAAVFINNDDEVSTEIELRMKSGSLGETTSTALIVEAEVNKGAPQADVTVTLSFSSNDAILGTDYRVATSPAQITILKDQVEGEATIRIDPVDDLIDEDNETITITGLASGGLSVPVTNTKVAIEDNDTVTPIITLTVDNDSFGEWQESATPVRVTATISGDVTRGEPTEVTLSLPSGTGATATKGTDYSTSPDPLGTITIPEAMKSVQSDIIEFTPIQDDLNEGTETIVVGGAVTGDTVDFTVNSTSIRLADDDLPAINLSLGDVKAVAEGQPATFEITATRDTSVTTAQVRVSLEVLSTSTADSGADYTPIRRLPTVIIPSGQASGTGELTITALPDLEVEGNETIVVGGTADNFIVEQLVSLTVQDTTAQSDGVTLTVTPARVAESAGSTPVTVTATLNGAPLGAATTVALALDTTGTAESGIDYADPGALPSITIAAGSVSGEASFNLDPTQDSIDEGDGETITVTGDATGGLTATADPATITIADDDTASGIIDLSVSPTRVAENGGQTAVTVTARLRGPVTRGADTVVDLSALDSSTATATGATADYSGSLPDMVTIPAELPSGETASFNITPVNDSDVEGDETIVVGGESCLTVPSGNDPCPDADMLTVNPATITLTDDDATVVTLRADPTSFIEGSRATIRITAIRSVAHNSDRVSVPLSVLAESTATAGVDYTAPASLPTIVIPANGASASRTVTITSLQDRLLDPGETIVVGSTAATGVSVNPVRITIDDDDVASTEITLSASPERLPESAGAAVTVTAELNGAAPSEDLTVMLSLFGLEATGNSDYSDPSPLLLTIPAGSVSGTVSFDLDPVDDNIDEDDEEIGIGASLGSEPELKVNSTTIVLTDDDTASNIIDLSVSPARIAEDAVQTAVTVTATLRGSATRAVDTSVLLFVDTSTATGNDYTIGTLSSFTLPAGESSVETSVTITPTDDDDVERDETIVLGGSTQGGIRVNRATVTLVDDDSPSTSVTLRAGASISEAAGGVITVPVTATLDGGVLDRDVTVTLTLGGTATRGRNGTDPGADYLAAPVKPAVTIPAGQKSADIDLAFLTLDDRVDEGDSETIVVGGTATGRLTVNAATITLDDNDAAPDAIDLTVSDSSVGEGESSAVVVVTATLKRTSDGVSVARTTDTRVGLSLGSTGTASAGVDYRVSPDPLGTIIIPAGQFSGTRTIRVRPIQDREPEGADETIVVRGTPEDFIDNPVTVNPATINLVDDDSPSTSLTLRVNSARLPESSGRRAIRVTASLDGGTRTSDVEVRLSLSGSAEGRGVDYAASGGPLDSEVDIVIEAGQTRGSVSFDLDLVDDRIDEGDGEVIVVGGTASIAGRAETLSVTGAAITITDNDTVTPEIVLSVGPPSLDESETTAQTVTVTATLQGDVALDTDVELSLTLAGTAVSGTDYADPGTLPAVTIPARGFTSTAVTFTITPTNDTEAEGNETIDVIGTAAGFKVVGDTINLVDDDATPPERVEDVEPAPRGGSSVTLRWDQPASAPEPEAGGGAGGTSGPRISSSPSGSNGASVQAQPEGGSQSARTSQPGPILRSPQAPQDPEAEPLVQATEDPEAPAEKCPDGCFQIQQQATGSVWVNITPEPLDASDVCRSGRCAFTVTGLDSSIDYQWRVIAVDLQGEQEQEIPSEPSDPLRRAVAVPRPQRGGGGTPGGGGGTPGGGGGGPAPEPEPEPELLAPSRLQPPRGGAQAPLPADVAPESVFAGGILAVYRLGVMTLVSIDPGPTGAVRGFAPERSMSRADVAAPLVRFWQGLDRDCPTTASAPFNDIDDPQLAADANCLRGLGITTGTTATTYSPERPVTRAQTASLLIRVWRLLGRECPADDAPPFDDVAPGSVHHDDVLCLRGLGITSGTTATTFSPDRHVSRAEFATMLARLHNLINPPSELEPEPEPELLAPSRLQPPRGGDRAALPSDVAPESVFAGGILTVYRLGVMTLVSIDPGPDAPSGAAVRGFAPERSMSRADVAAPLVRLWQVLDRDCPTAASAPFDDIDDPQLAADAGCLRGLGITAGTTATTYSPERPVTRAETASLLIRVWRLLGRECPDDDAPPFDDVPPSSVHHDNVLCLRGLGITSGTTATTFSPDRHVSRAEFATLIARLHNLAT